MALTQVQKVEILKYTGWGYGAIEPNHIDYNSKVFSVMNSIPEYLEPMIADIVAKIKSVETTQSGSVSKHGVKRIDDIEFFEGASTTSAPQLEKNRLARELASLLGLPIGAGIGSSSGFGMKGVCV